MHLNIVQDRNRSWQNRALRLHKRKKGQPYIMQSVIPSIFPFFLLSSFFPREMGPTSKRLFLNLYSTTRVKFNRRLFTISKGQKLGCRNAQDGFLIRSATSPRKFTGRKFILPVNSARNRLFRPVDTLIPSFVPRISTQIMLEVG